MRSAHRHLLTMYSYLVELNYANSSVPHKVVQFSCLKYYKDDYGVDVPDKGYIVTFGEEYEWDEETYPDEFHKEMGKISNYPRFRP